jgi:hypothetical protein
VGLKLATVGVTAAGKSSLINDLIGRKVTSPGPNKPPDQRDQVKKLSPPRVNVSVASVGDSGENERFVAAVVEKAIDIIGDREDALRWLGTPIRALGYATPISRLGDDAGAKEVLAVLDQLAQGVW